ncbi:MAG: hypothetical protein ABI972_01590 [Acidobacteriota bacterium]
MNTLKKPLSEAKLRANRENAKKSTGPRTEAGKARSARNAITHGITARDITALGEHYRALPELIQHFTNSWNPRNPFEAALIKRLAELQLRLDRCARMETGLLDLDMPPVTSVDSHESINSALANSFASNEGKFNVFSRYEANLSRAFDRTLKQLLAIRKQDLRPRTAPDETNPKPVEDIQPPPPAEPNSQDIRFDLNPPAGPADARNRRHGNFIPFPERTSPPVRLIWIDEYGNERTELGRYPSNPNETQCP